MALGFAMRRELEAMLPFFALIQRVEREDVEAYHGAIAGQGVLLYVCGIGKVNSAVRTLRVVQEFAPLWIVNVGVCGSISPVLEVGDLALGSAYVYHDVWCGEGNAFGQVQGCPARYAGDGGLLTGLRRAGAVQYAGLFCTGEYFVPTEEEVGRIRSAFPEVLTVDMESAAIAQVCHMLSKPFASLRLVSDTPGRPADHAAQYAHFWGTMAGEGFGRVYRVFEDYFLSLG